MIKTILIDLDDTIFDFQAAEHTALHTTLLAMGVTPTPTLLTKYSAINAAQWRLLEQGKLTREQVLTRRFVLLFNACNIFADVQAVAKQYEQNLEKMHFFLPGAKNALHTLAQTYRLFLVTNGSCAVQRRRLRDAKIDTLFTALFISEEIGAEKPSAAFFNHCFAQIPNFRKEDCILVGDSLSADIRGGNRAGLRTVWVNTRGATCGAEQPDATIASLAELPALLDTLQKE